MPAYQSLSQEFRGLQPKFSRLYTRILNHLGLTQPQYALLVELHHAREDAVTMTCISQKLYITKPAVTNLVDRLEQHGFLKRVEHPSDRRVFLLQIEPSGRQAVDRVQDKFLEIILQAAGALKPAEVAAVEKFYRKLSGSVDSSLDCHKSCRIQKPVKARASRSRKKDPA